ncbi:hypothetical protein HDU98_004154 [Podochytrium sp. JEL0797]|nr:hypothetical protein HDU98_004154 [Podochytrium sp. JEL0797]
MSPQKLSDMEKHAATATPTGKVVCGIEWTKKRVIIAVSSVLVILTAVLLVIFLFVVPKIAQSSIDSSHIVLTSSKISAPTENSFMLSGAGTVSDAGHLDATLTFPEPVDVYWTNRTDGEPDLPLGTVFLAPITVSGSTGSGEVVMDSMFNISSVENMAAFSAFMINSVEFSWRLSGVAAAKAMGLTVKSLTFNQVITMAGFDGLNKVSINSFDLPSSDVSNGIHIATTSTIENPSSITLDLGDVLFNLHGHDMTHIGSLFATDVIMSPGANTIPMKGNMLVNNAFKLSYLMNTFLLSGKGLDSIIVGNSSSYGASWVDASLQNTKIHLNVPSPILAGPIVSELDIPTMAVSMNASDPSGMSVSLSAPVCTAKFTLPYTFPIDVTKVQQTLDFVDIESGTAFAKLTTKYANATTDQSTNVLTTSVSAAKLVAIKGKEAMFAHFMAGLTFADKASVNIKGSATSVVDTHAGVATIKLPLTDTLTLEGFQGFQDVEVISTKVIGGDAEGVHLAVDIVLNNPSTVSLSTNVDVTMDLQIGGVIVGRVVMPMMQVVPGPNAVSSAVTMFYGSDVESQMALRHVMSGFIAGQSVESRILGSVDSIIYESLKPAFSKLAIPATISGPQDAVMVVSSELTPGDAKTGRPSMNVFTIANPLDAAYTLHEIKATVSVQTPKGLMVIGNIDVKLQNPVTVPAHSQAKTESIPLIQTPAQIASSGVENSFMLSGAGTVSDAGHLDATLTFPEPVDVYWTNRSDGEPDLPLGTVFLSPVTVSGSTGSGEVVMDSQFNISSVENMATFSAFMINSVEFSWRLSGVAAAKAMGLTVKSLTFNQVITMAGFDGLKTVSIDSFDLPSSDAVNGIHINTTSTIQNPSSITLDLGDVLFNLHGHDMTHIGSLFATDVIMTPGANTIPMTGNMKVENPLKLSYLMNTFLLSGKGLDSIIVGNSSSYGVSWVDASLQNTQIHITVPSPILDGPIVSDLDIPAMAVSMNASDPSGMSVSLSAPVCTAKFTLPYTFPIDVTKVQQTLDFVDIESGIAFATLTTAFGNSTTDQSTNVLTTSVSGGKLVAIPGQEAMFAHFMAGLTFADEASVNIKGSATSVVDTHAGVATIKLPLTDILTLEGFQGFQDVEVLSTKVIGGDVEGVHLAVDIILNNPSTVSLSTNVDVTMDLQIGGVIVGRVVMPMMQVVPGPNAVSSAVTMFYGSDVESQMALRHVMSGFIAGQSVESRILGSVDSIIYESLKPAFSKLAIPATISGPQDAVMVVSSELTPGDAKTGRPSMNVFTIANPLDAAYTLHEIKATVSVQTPKGLMVIGNIDVKLQNPVTVPAHSQAKTESIPLIQTPAQIASSGVFVMSLLMSGKDTMLANANQTLSATIGSYPVMLDYQANDVPVKIIH